MADFETARRTMVDNQLRTSNITDHRLLAAMGEVPRELFVPADRQGLAYADLDHKIASGRALSAPAPFAKLVQLADIRHADDVLVVGTGTGYSTAVLARLAAAVTGIESDSALAEGARKVLTALGVSNATILTAPVEGAVVLPATYDVIIVEGTLPSEPAAYFSALREGGRLVAVIRDGAASSAHVFVRSGADVAGRIEFNANLPPLAAVARPEAFVF